MTDTFMTFLNASEQVPGQGVVSSKKETPFDQRKPTSQLERPFGATADQLRPDAILIPAAGFSTLTWTEYASTGVPTIPRELRYLEAAIERSRGILSWEDDWDGEGSPGYAQATWDRAVAFVICNAMRLYSHRSIRVVAPDVLPGPDGSIDIHWQNTGRDLLINVPVEEGEPATFHGDDSDNSVVKGCLNLSARNEWLLTWLME